MTIPTRCWGDIVGSLQNTAKGDGKWLIPLLSFVQQIAESKYVDQLYGYLSMQCLCIAQTAEIYEGQERFLIVFDPTRNKFRFAYSDAGGWGQVMDAPPRLRGKLAWYRETSIEESYPLFLKFLGQIGWIPELKPESIETP